MSATFEQEVASHGGYDKYMQYCVGLLSPEEHIAIRAGVTALVQQDIEKARQSLDTLVARYEIHEREADAMSDQFRVEIKEYKRLHALLKEITA